MQPPFGVLVVPLDLEYLQPALSIGERFGDDGHSALTWSVRAAFIPTIALT